jgi:hypothetical protein
MAARPAWQICAVNASTAADQAPFLTNTVGTELTDSLGDWMLSSNRPAYVNATPSIGFFGWEPRSDE